MVKEDLKVEKVLITADSIGGVWTYVLELARAFQSYGVRFYVATMGHGLSKAQCEDILKTSNMEIFSSRYKLEWMQDPWKDIDEAGNWLLDLQDQINPDIIHLNNYAFGALSWKAPVLIVAHSCVATWWHAVKGEPVPEEWAEYQKRIKEGLAAVNLVVGISHSYLENLKASYGPVNESMIIYNGLNPRHYLRNKKLPFIFAMGRIWDEGKNLKMLADIDTIEGWPVYIAGNPRDPSGSDDHYIKDNLLGQLTADKVKEYLSEASIFVHPAKYEPFGLAALEAGLSGCALILSDIPSLREIWKDSAIFFKSNDPGTLKEAISKLINDEKLRVHYQQKAYERAKFFSIDIMADNYYKTYQKLVNNYRCSLGSISDN